MTIPNTEATDLTAPVDAEGEAARVGLDHAPRTELGRLIVAARREFLGANGRFLTREELEREIAERRGGVDARDPE